jgi:hypothetical protein
MDDNGRRFRIVPNTGPGGGPYIRDHEPRATPDRAAMFCPKCGSTDIVTRWHRSDLECTWQQRSRAGFKHMGQHLHRTCHGCQFDWPEDTLDSVVAV